MSDRLADLVLPDSTPVEPHVQKTEGKAPAPERKRPVRKSRPASVPRRSRPRSLSGSDLVIAGSGLALAFACAVFPWYIFFNQEDFGTRPVRFRGPPSPQALPQSAGIDLPEAIGRLAAPLAVFPVLDTQATGTVTPGAKRTASESEQPFPGAKPDFRLVLVANGRGMIADKDGYWVVQPGSWLPDGSRVRALERRQEGWVLVTTGGTDIAISK